MSSAPSAQVGLAFAIAAAAGYGLNAVTAQMAATAGLGGVLVVFWRVVLMLASVVALALIWRASLAIHPRERAAMAVFGLSSAVIGMAYLSSLAFLPVSVAAVVFYLFPILIVLAEPVVEHRRFSVAKLVVVLIGFGGVALVVGGSAGAIDWRGVALALLAAVGAAVQFFAGTRMPRSGLMGKLFWSHLIVLPIVVATLAVFGGFKGPAAFAAAPVAMAVTIGAFLISFALQMMALARVSAAVGGLAFLTEPLFATGFAALLLGERLSGWQYLGAALTLAAVGLNAARALRGDRR
jgi:drug/metabolite transporter (DMT)-like permease